MLLSRRAARRLRTASIAVTAIAAMLTWTLTAGSAEAAAAVSIGRVTFVADGDTVDVNLQGDGTRRAVRVRYIGIQAMELSVYSQTLAKLRGECWGVDAARNLTRLIDGRRVRLTARKASSVSGRNVRPRRHVAVMKDGRWTDTGALQVAAGLALPDLLYDEYSQNLNYMRAAQTAAATGQGMYGNPTKCGYGPNQTEQLKVTVNWDAEGNDSQNVNGEWVDITNLGSVAVPLGGWWVRDAAYRGERAHGYTFPAGAVVQPRATLRVHVGSGNDGVDRLYWGLSKNIFANVTDGARWMGDGAWLFDPEGDLRAWDMYPCRAAC